MDTWRKLNHFSFIPAPGTCKEWLDEGATVDGVYRLYLEGWGFANVYCDMTNGGWILFQRNLFPGTTFFTRNWEAFKTGFGDLTQSFWMGNELLHFISKKMGSMEFFVQLLD